MVKKRKFLPVNEGTLSYSFFYEQDHSDKSLNAVLDKIVEKIPRTKHERAFANHTELAEKNSEIFPELKILYEYVWMIFHKVKKGEPLTDAFWSGYRKEVEGEYGGKQNSQQSVVLEPLSISNEDLKEILDAINLLKNSETGTLHKQTAIKILQEKLAKLNEFQRIKPESTIAALIQNITANLQSEGM